MAFTWINEIPTAGTKVVTTNLPLEVRLNLDSIRDSLCTTHYFSHDSAKYSGYLTTNYKHNIHYASLKSYDGAHKGGYDIVKSHDAADNSHDATNKSHDATDKSYYATYKDGHLTNVL